MTDLTQFLNPSQIEAAAFKDGPALVIAGAGTGKTRVLEYRTLYLIEQGISDDQILLLTFTRKAAQEMLRRSSQHNAKCRRVPGGTFHSFATGILRKYANLLGISNQFTILDRSDSEDLINVIRADIGLAATNRRFPKKSTLMDILSTATNKQVSVETILEDEYPQFADDLKELENIRHRYKEKKQLSNLLDYDDLLTYLNLLLMTFPKVKQALQEQYRYLMVDEYQDTNAVQGDIVRNLADIHRNVLVVGDDMQSIYKFRGASFENIIRFPKDFPEAKLIKLEQNYRSRQSILNASNAVINQVKGEHYTKTLFTDRGEGERPTFIEFSDPMSEASWIAQKVLEAREQNVALNEIAILFRSSYISNELEVELKSRNIPYVKYGGLKFMEAAHVKDIICILRAANNPTDEVSWMRTLTMLPKIGGIKAREVFLKIKSEGLEKGLKSATETQSYSSEELNKLANLLLSPRIDTLTPSAAMEKAIKYYQPLLRENYDDWNKREEDLTSLKEISQKYERLGKMLEDLALEPPNESVSDVKSDTENEPHLVLSTIHSAKGLEWHTVILLGAQEGILPHYKSVDKPSELEEERRMFYVAITRAKENLFLTMSHGHSTNSHGWGLELPSRFVLPLLDNGSIEMESKRDTDGRVFGHRIDLNDDSLKETLERASWQI